MLVPFVVLLFSALNDGRLSDVASPRLIRIFDEKLKSVKKVLNLMYWQTELVYCVIRSTRVLFLFHFYDILTIPIKLISRQVHKWSLISTPFWDQDSTRYAWSSNQLASLVDHLQRSQLWYDSLLCKGLRSINKQFSIDSFLDCEG